MEFVYVVKRYDLFDRSFPHGFVTEPDAVAEWTLRIRERGFFLERRQAEQDSSFKQIIPYTLVLHGEQVLLLRRLAQGGEARRTAAATCSTRAAAGSSRRRSRSAAPTRWRRSASSTTTRATWARCTSA